MANPATTQDCRKLIAFLDDVKTVSDEIINARVILFRENLRAPLESACVTSVRNTIEIVQNELRNPAPGLDVALGNAGLSENELTFKLQGFQGAFDRFWRRGTVNLLDKLLKWINTI